MWESNGFSECANSNLLIKRRPRHSQKPETGRIWSGNFFLASSQRHVFRAAAHGDSWEAKPRLQSVPRAELRGAIRVLSRFDETTNIQIPIERRKVSHTGGSWKMG